MPARLPCTQATTPTKAATHQTPAPRPAPIQDNVLAELATQLRGEAGPRQVKGAEVALAENGGGVIGMEEAVASVVILKKE